MLRALNTPDGRPRRPRAYRVPWVVDRPFDLHPLVTNAGAQPADFVRVFIHAAGTAGTTEHWGQMLPGESAELCLCDGSGAVVTIAWFRPEDGGEYVWRFAV
jgi:hypothetical protein